MQMLTTRRALLALALVLLAVLSGCGFRLRGEAQTHMPFKTIFLGLPATSTLAIELKRNIRAVGGAEVVADPKLADAILQVMQPERQDIIAIATVAGQPVEYRLYYKFAFRVKDNKDQELLPTASFSLYRDVDFSAAQALAMQSEDQLLYKDMQADLVQQILRRLAAIKMP
jgi:LPS-assembly lipoprotein